jgi:CRISPR system Cascade subunit CasA
VKGDISTITQEFWEQSETYFYKLLDKLTCLPGDQRLAPAEIYAEWLNILQVLAYKLFDKWVLESPAEDLDMKRIITARRGLKEKLNNSKPMKDLIAKAKKKKGDKDAANTAISIP